MGKNKAFPAYKTLKKDGMEVRFVQIGNSQLLSEAMNGLNHAAFRLYVYMVLESRGNEVFEFPFSKYKRFLSKQGFQDSRAELVEAGFIDIIQHSRNLRKPNRYKFSCRWKDNG